MVTPNSDADSPSSNVVDLLLKYSAAAVAVIYALGFLERVSFVLTVSPEAAGVRLASATYLLAGFFVAVVCTGPSVAAILFVELAGHASVLFLGRPTPHWLRNQVRLDSPPYRRGFALSLTISAFLAMLTIGKSMHLSLWWVLSLGVGASIVNLVVSLALMDPEQYFSATVRQQLSLLMVLAIGLSIFAIALGVGRARSVLYDPSLTARLLIAPEAIDGIKSFGVAFPDAPSRTGSAELTESLRVLYAGESVYVVRANNGRILEIRNDKVWSVAPSP